MVRKYQLLSAIEEAVFSGMRNQNGKFDTTVLTIKTPNTSFGIKMTDPSATQDDESKKQFDTGCVLVVALGNDPTQADKKPDWNKGGMIGKWCDYLYGDANEYADLIYYIIADYFRAKHKEWADEWYMYVYSIEED